jgi:hypothetical protein
VNFKFVDQRPPLTHVEIVQQALKNSKKGFLNFEQIYNYYEENFAFFNKEEFKSKWKVCEFYLY